MPSTSDLLELKVSNFNIVAATLGGFLSLFGLVSYLLKEKFYLGEPLISTVAGLIFSPHATNLVKPLDYAHGSQETLDSITLYFTRLVLGVQLVLAGIQLPSKYLQKEWKSLSLLLGPAMCSMWICTSLLIWALVPNISFLHSLAVGACVTPTDPVLSNSIVKGKFADKNIPKELQKIIIAESGANDGLGYPFLFLALYLIQYTGDAGRGSSGGVGTAMGYWFGITWGYVIVFSVLYGALVGWVFKEALHWAEERKWVDRESFLVFAITLALFIVGTMGMLGSDDVLACFIAGNSFTWDDWFRLETADDSFQPTIDMLLNVSIFAWYGAICPWRYLAHNDVIPLYRLIPLGILILLFRRLPIVLALHRNIHQIEEWRQAMFVGFFGPIGVSAIFYLYTSVDYLKQITMDGTQREDAAHLAEVITVVVWFLAMCSIIVHGLSIPVGKIGFRIPRTFSMSRNPSSEPKRNSDDIELTNLGEPLTLRVHHQITNDLNSLRVGVRQRPEQTWSKKGEVEGQGHVNGRAVATPSVIRIGGTIMNELRSNDAGSEYLAATGRKPGDSGFSTNRRNTGVALSEDIKNVAGVEDGGVQSVDETLKGGDTLQSPVETTFGEHDMPLFRRVIRFPQCGQQQSAEPDVTGTRGLTPQRQRLAGSRPETPASGRTITFAAEKPM